MGRDANRKRYHADSPKRSHSGFSVARTLHSVKRRRLSDEGSEARPSTSDSRGSVDRIEDDGWQTVTSKSSRRRQHQRRDSHSQASTYPKLSFHDTVTQPVRIEQLRDLALYVMADGTAPNWVAVRSKNDIRKVVAIMLPGLDEEMLQRARELRKEATAPANDGDLHMTTGDESSSIINHDSNSPDLKNDPDSPSLAPASTLPRDLGWLIENTIPVRAPGDSKFARIHSPLQAMLMADAVDVDKTLTKKQVEKQFRPVQTCISYFVHTADELREAEYPIHPALFTSDADAALEASRRESAGQAAADGWVDSQVREKVPSTMNEIPNRHQDAVTQGLKIVAIDCEMVLTSDEKSSLARISAVAWPSGKIVLDKYVKPDLAITNYFTQFSGITPKILENVTTKLSDVQQELIQILDKSTIILGHSLESDLNALKMTHPFVVDTSMIYPHPRGLPLRSSLKFLANKYLKREIQKGGATGHDSVEDAKAVLDLVRLKCEKGPKWGTTEANGEPIFKRLTRVVGKNGKPRTSAIIEYGSSPERGLGKDATYAIGCQTDEEIAAGVIRVVQGDADGKEIPAGGADFVWGRFRALEFARGWVTNNYGSNTTTSTTANAAAATTEPTDSSTGQQQTTNDQPETGEHDIDKALLTTLNHISQIRRSLPPTTLLILYNGTSDVRPVVHYQNMQAQYRKEFKVKKWDEISVKWTDTEEQALRNAVEKARRGWGWVGVV